MPMIAEFPVVIALCANLMVLLSIQRQNDILLIYFDSPIIGRKRKPLTQTQKAVYQF